MPVDLHIGDDPPHACAVFIDTPEGRNALATIVGAARGPTPAGTRRREAGSLHPIPVIGLFRRVGAALHS